MTVNSWKHKILRSLPFDTKDKVSIFINKRNDLAIVASILKELCNNTKIDVRLTSFDIELPPYFQDPNIKIEYSWDYLNAEDCVYVDEFFFKNLVRNWFLFETSGQDYINEYRKSLLGKAVEFRFIISNFTLIKYIEVVRKIFMNYRPTKILIIEDVPFLVNIVKLFDERCKFKFIKINPASNPILKRLRSLIKTAKVFLVDLAILLLDFFILRYNFMFKRFENKILIDYRLYKNFANTKLKQQLLICPFEKGLKIRLQMLSKGLFYLPLQAPSYFDFFLQGNEKSKLIANWNKIKVRSDIKSIFKYRDIVFWDVIEGYLSQVFLVDFPRVMANVAIFQRLAQKKKIKLIIMRNDMKEMERTLIEAGRPLKIPTLVIQHGMVGNSNLDTTLDADMTAAWGNASIKWFKQFGYPENRFTVTGNPLHDELYYRISRSHQDVTRRQICQMLNLNPTKKIVTFLTHSNYLFGTCFNRGDKNSSMLRAILKAMEFLPDIQLIVKLHPYDESLHAYNNIIKDFNLNTEVAVVQEVNTFDILEASDLAIMVCSSTGLEALILDKVLVALMLDKTVTSIIPYAEKGVAIAVRKNDDIELAIRNGLYDEKTREALRLNRERFILDYAYKIDGQATKRVEELMYKLMNNNGILTSTRNRNEYLVSKSSM